jgi:hypothetical protein
MMPLAGGVCLSGLKRTRAVPFTMGKSVKGWGVVRNSPWHFAGLYPTKQEADAKAREMGSGYVVRLGEEQVGTGIFLSS